VTSIGNSAFYMCTSLTSVSIPATVQSINGYAFYGDYNIKSVTFAGRNLRGAEGIGDYAFAYCSNLTSITIGTDYTSQNEPHNPNFGLGDYAFDGCTSLKSVTFNGNVTAIGPYAFANCYNLTDVTFDTKYLSTIGEGAFYDDISIKKLEIPGSVTSVGQYAFHNCSNLTTVKYFGSSNPASGMVVFDESCVSLKYVCVAPRPEFGTQTISTNAFGDFNGLYDLYRCDPEGPSSLESAHSLVPSIATLVALLAAALACLF